MLCFMVMVCLVRCCVWVFRFVVFCEVFCFCSVICFSVSMVWVVVLLSKVVMSRKVVSRYWWKERLCRCC